MERLAIDRNLPRSEVSVQCLSPNRILEGSSGLPFAITVLLIVLELALGQSVNDA
jgi:hypothetical protein